MGSLLNWAGKLGFIEVDRADGRVNWINVNAISGLEEPKAQDGTFLLIDGTWLAVRNSRTEVVRRMWQVLRQEPFGAVALPDPPAPIAKEECPPTCLCTDCVREKTRPGAGNPKPEPAPGPVLPWRVLLKSKAFGHPWAAPDDAPDKLPTRPADIWAVGYNAGLADLSCGKPLPQTGEILRDITKELNDTAQAAYEAGEGAGRQNAVRAEAPKPLDPGAFTAIATGPCIGDEGPDVAAVRLFIEHAGPLLFGWQQDDNSLRGALRALYVRGRADGARAKGAPVVEHLGPTQIGNPTDNRAIERTRMKLVPFFRPNINTLHPTVTAALEQLWDDATIARSEASDSVTEPRPWPVGGHPPFMGQVDINDALSAHVSNGVIKCTYARVVDATQAALRRVWAAGCDVADGKNDAAEREQYQQGKRAGWAMGWAAAWAAVRQIATVHGLGKAPPPMPADDAAPMAIEGKADDGHMVIEGGDNEATS